MQKIEQLKHIVCNARYYCRNFPPSKSQYKSNCLNCSRVIGKYNECLAGISELPVICKSCYDVLKHTFEVDLQTEDSDGSEIGRPRSFEAFVNDEKLPISTPKNIKNIIYDTDEDILRESK